MHPDDLSLTHVVELGLFIGGFIRHCALQFFALEDSSGSTVLTCFSIYSLRTLPDF